MVIKMNFFTDELKKIADRSEYIRKPKFVGQACVFRLSDDVTGKLEFVTGMVANHFNALRLKLFNKSEGPIDTQLIGIGDVIGNKMIYANVQSPYICKNGNEVNWYGYKPTDSDYSGISENVDDYLSCFAEQELSEDEELSISLT